MQFRRAVRGAVGATILVALGVAASCQPPTQVRLVVRADMLCGTPVTEGYGIQEVHIFVGSRESVASRIGGVADAVIQDCSNISTPGTMGDLVLHRGDSDSAFVQIVAGLVRTTASQETRRRPADACRFEDPNNSNCLMAMRSFSYKSNATGYLPVTLQTSCIPKWFTCPARQTCINGECVDDSVNLEPTLEPWVPPRVVDAGAPDTSITDAAPDVVKDGAPDADAASIAFPTALALGDMHSCARYNNGGVVCWGKNDAGQLGRGNANTVGDGAVAMGSLGFIDLGPGVAASTVAAAPGRTCAIRGGAGGVACWGKNDGQLGLEDGPLGSPNKGAGPNDMGSNLQGVKLGFGTVSYVAMGHFHACAAESGTDRIKCWGGSISGELGQGDALSHGRDTGSMGTLQPLPFLLVPPAYRLTALAAGTSHTCTVVRGVMGDTHVKCWGLNGADTDGNIGAGTLGVGDRKNRGDTSGSIETLIDVRLGTDITVKKLTVGGFHACVIFDSPSLTNAVKCWGSNRYGQLGLGSTLYRGGEPGMSVNDFGGFPMTFGTLDDGLPPVALGGPVRDIAAGDWHTCALLSDGRVKCWGRNNFGQLGYGDTTDRGRGPDDMSNLAAVNLGLEPNETVETLAAGQGGFTANGTHTCALLSTHRIKCWGRNDAGQLGLDDTNHRGDVPGEMGVSLPYVKLPKLFVP